jgi:hypothetical protein
VGRVSARGSYEAPVFHVHEASTSGIERRSTHPIKQLGRALNSLCLEAADPYEIAAHLEALGYNNRAAIGKFGVADHFELAHELFYSTPRRLPFTRPSAELRRNYTRQAVMVLTLLVSVAMGSFAIVNAWSAVIWLLVWSQLGGALLNRARSELTPLHQEKVLTLLLALGLAGLGMCWLFTLFGPVTASVSLLWFGVAGLLWAERLHTALLLSALIGAECLLVIGLGLPLLTLFLGVALTVALILRPFWCWIPLHSWRWALAQGPHVGPFIAYGLGQGALLLTLLRGAGREVLPGLILFALLLLISDTHLTGLRQRLNLYLWREDSAVVYGRLARLTLVRYCAIYLLAFAPALAVYLVPALGGEASLYHLAGFALFGVLLGLSLVALSLGNSLLPAVVFSLGGVLLLLGLPFFWIAGAMALGLFAEMLRRIALLGRYGVYLL